jgi:hypothetical protein
MPEPTLPAGLLEELPEARASGELQRIYGEIRQLSGVPMVALIYRHLATIPGALEWAWGLLAPAMRAGVVQQRAWQLAEEAGIARQPRIPLPALLAVGLDAGEQRGIAAVLDAYNRANPVNLMAVRCLSLHLRGQAGAPPDSAPWLAWEAPRAPAPLPPMIDPAAMPVNVRAMAQLLTDRGPGNAPSTLWPSLYRHLAHWPAFLGYATVLVPPEFQAIDAAAARLRNEIDAAAVAIAARLTPASTLDRPAGAQAQRLQAAIEQFSGRIPEMVLIGNLLRRALPAETH